MSALDVTAILDRLKGVKGSGRAHTAFCPAHPDTRQSLSIGTGDDGKVLLHCHAGCTFQEINAALDGAASSPAPAKIAGPTTERQAAVYTYANADETPRFQVVRYDILDHESRRIGKTFRQRRHIGAGDYAWGMTGTERVLYRLPAIIEAAAMGRTVYVVEGEKDADRLAAVGLAATTSAGGAESKWLDGYSDVLRDADVVILPDNDDAGQKYARRIELALHGIARDVRTIDLPGLPPKGDVSDWLDSGRTVDELRSLMPAAPVVQPSRLRLYTDAELDALPEATMLVEDFAPTNGLVALIGAYGCGKSFTLLDLAFCIGVGADWHGRRVRRGPVVYLYSEGRHAIPKRLRACKAGYQYTGSSGIYFLPASAPLDDPATVTELLASIAATVPTPPVAVVVDTLARNMNGNENETVDMGRFVKGCDTIRETTGATVFLAHHPGWGGTRSRGSVALPGATDTEIFMRKDGDRLTLQCTKQKDAATFADIILETFPIAGSLAIRRSVLTGAALTPNERRALDEVQIAGDVKSGAWKSATGLAQGSFHDARRRLLELGYVKVERKIYSVTESGRQALSTKYNASTEQVQTPPSGQVQPPPMSIDIGAVLGPCTEREAA